MIGLDTMKYEVCVEVGNMCREALILVTVHDSTALNSTNATDDFIHCTKAHHLLPISSTMIPMHKVIISP